MKKYKRPSWDEYFFNIMDVVALRATCSRGRSGCVITKDNYIMATGYVGAPAGHISCDDGGHILKRTQDTHTGEIEEHCIRSVHAEQNAIMHAARQGISLKSSTLYCTMTPCATCAMLIIAAGILSVKCKKHYHNTIQEQKTLQLFKDSGVEITFKEEGVQEYE